MTHTRSEKEPRVLVYKVNDPKKHVFSPYMKALDVFLTTFILQPFICLVTALPHPLPLPRHLSTE